MRLNAGSRVSGPAARIYRGTFAAAAAWNFAFGLSAATTPQYPAIVGYVAIAAGLYGLAYAYASRFLDRASPIIAVGLVAKVLAIIGWLFAKHPMHMFAIIVFDDAIWLAPFALFLLEGTATSAWLKRRAAFLCGAMHVIAAAGTLALIRRMEFGTQNPDCWRFGWMLWMVAALSLVGFYLWWRPDVMPFAIAAGGLACDFAGESILIGWLPAAGSALSRWAALLTGGAANGLYTIAGMVLTLRSPDLPQFLRWWACAAWISGAALTLATVAGSARGVTITSAALMATFTSWVFAFATFRR